MLCIIELFICIFIGLIRTSLRLLGLVAMRGLGRLVAGVGIPELFVGLLRRCLIVRTLESTFGLSRLNTLNQN